jgi:hypothetical protein
MGDEFVISFVPYLFVLYKYAQRQALPASGRDEIRFENRKNSKPENYRKKPQNPTCRVHALLGVFLEVIQMGCIPNKV